KLQPCLDHRTMRQEGADVFRLRAMSYQPGLRLLPVLQHILSLAGTSGLRVLAVTGKPGWGWGPDLFLPWFSLRSSFLVTHQRRDLVVLRDRWCDGTRHHHNRLLVKATADWVRLRLRWLR